MSSIFKIRRNSDGLFSGGGTCPSFSKIGKTWTSYRALRLHLAQFIRNLTPYSSDRYKDCEIIEYEYVETSRQPLQEYLENLENLCEEREQKEKERQESLERWRKEQRHKEFLKLKEEFES